MDVDNEVIHRRGSQDARTKKRQPPVCIYARLLPHLRRWRKMDMAHGITNVIHFWGRSLTRVHAAWQSIRTEVGNKRRDSPHVLRHSSATLFMASGEDVAMIAGFLGMSTDTLMETYGHHHPQFQERVAQATPKKQTNRKRTG